MCMFHFWNEPYCVPRSTEEYFSFTWTPEFWIILCNDGKWGTPSRSSCNVSFSILGCHCQTLRVPLANGQILCSNGACPPIFKDIKLSDLYPSNFLLEVDKSVIDSASVTFAVVSRALILPGDAYPNHLQAHIASQMHDWPQKWPLLADIHRNIFVTRWDEANFVIKTRQPC